MPCGALHCCPLPSLTPWACGSGRPAPAPLHKQMGQHFLARVACMGSYYAPSLAGCAVLACGATPKQSGMTASAAALRTLPPVHHCCSAHGLQQTRNYQLTQLLLALHRQLVHLLLVLQVPPLLVCELHALQKNKQAREDAVYQASDLGLFLVA